MQPKKNVYIWLIKISCCSYIYEAVWEMCSYRSSACVLHSFGVNTRIGQCAGVYDSWGSQDKTNSISNFNQMIAR